jgi:hypothetical protein
MTYSPKVQTWASTSAPLWPFKPSRYIRKPNPTLFPIGYRIGQEIHSPMEHFGAGDKATFSGVYKALHEKDHIPPHYVTAVYGEIFPS